MSYDSTILETVAMDGFYISNVLLITLITVCLPVYYFRNESHSLITHVTEFSPLLQNFAEIPSKSCEITIFLAKIL